LPVSFIFILALIFITPGSGATNVIQAAPVQSVSGLPVVSFTSASTTVGEATPTATNTVQVSPAPATSNVTVEYLTINVTAQAGTDYLQKAGTFTFTATTTQQNI
jgi:hypothetical protein